MSQDIASLVLRVDSLEARNAAKDVERLHKEGSKAEGIFKGFGSTLAKLGVGMAIGAVLRGVIRNTIEAEQAQAQLEARLKSTGGVSGMTMGSLNALADSLMSVTTFSDEAIRTSEALMLTFTKIGKDVFPAAQEAALNMSVALGTDLQTATLQLGKALNDPILGITALSRAGVQFSDDQKKVIKSLVDTGKTSDAQKIILKELETQMGDAARAARNTLGGAIENLKNQFGELIEGDSKSAGVRGATASINQLANTVSDPAIKEGFAALASGIISVTGAIFEGLGLMGQYIARIREMVKLNAAVAKGNSMSTTNQANLRLAQIGTREKQVKSGQTFGVSDMARFGTEDKAYTKWRIQNKKAYSANEELKFLVHERQQAVRQYTAALREENIADATAEKVAKIRAGVAAAAAEAPKVSGGGGGKKGGGGSKASDGAKAKAEAADTSDLDALRRDMATEEETIEASYKERTAIIAKYRNISDAERTKLSERSKATYEKEREELRLSKGRELEDLRLSMRTETEVIAETYANRMALLRKNTEEGSAIRIEQEARITAERDESMLKYNESIANKIASLSYGLYTIEEMERASLLKQREDILNSTFITEELRRELLLLNKQKTIDMELDLERRKVAAQLSIQSGMFGAMSDLASAFAQGSGKNAKKMFEISKALSIAETIISTYLAAQNAYQDALAKHMGMPYAVMSAATAVIAGLARVMKIRNTQFSGGYDEGGYIPAGKYGIVGERGPEYVRGPAMVTSRQETARQMSRGGGNVITLNSTFNINGTSSTQETSGDRENTAREFKRLVDARFHDLVNQEQRAGGSLWRMMR